MRRREAVEQLAGLPGQSSLAHKVLAELIASGPPADEQLAVAFALRGVDSAGTRAAITLGFSLLRQNDLPWAVRAGVFSLLADSGPQARRDLLAALPEMYAGPPPASAARLSHLRLLALWGPDAHRAVDRIWEARGQAVSGSARIDLAAELYKLGWISRSHASRLLAGTVHRADENPVVRLSAARALRSHGPQHCRAAAQVLKALVHERAVPPSLALQAARDLATAGALTEGRAVFAHLCADSLVPDALRYKAATLLLMADLLCGPQTRATLGYMAADPTLTGPTREWASFALAYAADADGLIPRVSSPES